MSGRAIVAATAVDCEPPLRGALVLRAVERSARLKYYLYVPRHLPRAPRLLVAVHGISRNAREHGQALAGEAERRGVVLLVPQFTEEFYPDYQRLGVGSGQHPDAALERMVADAEALLDVAFPTFWLFGYSGGGQFAHRFALVRPERVAALAVAAAGWYTWLSSDARFPFGLAPCPSRPELRCDIERFLAIPTCVLVGAQDICRDDRLRRSRTLDRQQGRNRFARAQRWFRSLANEGRRRGITTRQELKVLAASDHDFMRSVRRDHLERHTFDFLVAADSTARGNIAHGLLTENEL